MADNELREAINVELRNGGAIRTRKGSPWYQKQGFGGLTLTTAVRSMAHYSRFDGSKKVLAYSGNDLYDDDDNGEFSVALSNYESDEQKVRFAQWREAMFFTSRGSGDTASHGLRVYDSNLATKTRDIGIAGAGSITGQVTQAVAPAFTEVTGGVLVGGGANNSYLFRATFDIYQGNTFLGESGVLWDFSFPGPPASYEISGVLLAAGNTGYAIRSSAALAALAGNTSLGAINIYRSVANYVPVALVPYQRFIETNMVWVGAIPRDKWTDLATIHISDLGLFAGRSIAPYYARNFVRPPFGRHISTHKARMWVANVKYQYWDTAAWVNVQTLAPHRVYFSEVNEPGVFLATSWVEIDPTDGDGVTGIVSFKNKVLIVFQANSMWAISGGDEERGPGVPDISIENISTDIGCVAPDSIQICEGRIVWLSHRGVYFYDGTMPKPLKSDNIDGTIVDLRTASRYQDPAAIFLSKEREYWISHASTGETSIDNDQDYQTLISKFSFKNASWVRADCESEGLLPLGVASFVEKKNPNRPPIILAGHEGSVTAMTESAIRYMDVAGYDAEEDPIDWSFQTKFFDLGAPYMDKKYIAVLVQLFSESDVTMEVSCDNHLVDETFTISKTESAHADNDLIWDVGNWSDGITGSVWAGDNVRNALIYLNDKCWGKRISFRFSGSTTASPTEIQALTIFFDQKEGVRQ